MAYVALLTASLLVNRIGLSAYCLLRLHDVTLGFTLRLLLC